MQYSIVLNYKIARLSRRGGGWRNFLNLLLFLKFSAFLVALTLTCCFVFMHCTSSCIIVGLSDYHALQSYQSTTHGVMHWSIQSRLEQNVLVLLELKIFLEVLNLYCCLKMKWWELVLIFGSLTSLLVVWASQIVWKTSPKK